MKLCESVGHGISKDFSELGEAGLLLVLKVAQTVMVQLLPKTAHERNRETDMQRETERQTVREK